MLTIIIPVYNAANFLRQCLDSVLCQTYGQWECICVDDGSTDGSSEILEEYARQDKRFVVLQQENSGVSAARNRGLEAATGEWVTFLDADDWIAPDLYMRLCDLARQHPEADLIAHRAFWQHKGVQTACTRADELAPRIFASGDEVLGAVRTPYATLLYCVWDKVFRRSTLNRFGLQFERAIHLSEDSHFTQLYLAQCGMVIAAMDIRGYYYRMTETGAIHNITLSMCEQQLIRFEMLYNFWLKSRRPGLGLFLVKFAATFPTLGKVKYGTRGLRRCCVEVLVGSRVFSGEILRFLFMYGSMKARLFAVLYWMLPSHLKEKLLMAM